MAASAPASDERIAVGERIVAKRGVMRVTVTETGQLRPRDVEIVPGPIHGEILDLIEEGTYVKKGDKMAVIDAQESREYVERDELDLKAAKARHKGAELDRELTRKQLSIEVDLAKVVLAREEAQLKYLKAKPTEQERRDARIAVELAKARKEAAHDGYERSLSLWKKKVASKGQLIRDRLQHQQAEASYSKAVVEEELVLKGAPKEDLAIAGERVLQAKAKLEQAEKSRDAQFELKDTSVEVAMADVERKQEDLERGKKILASAVVYAPCEGTVLYNVHWGRPEEGKRVWRGSPFLDVVNLSRMVVETHVNEVDLSRIGLGQKVDVTLEAFPNEKFHGRVTRIAGIAKDRNERRLGMGQRDTSGVMIFELIVEIDESDERLRPTMTATLDIIVEEVQNAIAVPYRAIHEELSTSPGADGQATLRRYVWVESGGRHVRRSIATGVAGASGIVVTKGIENGDVVLVPKPSR